MTQENIQMGAKTRKTGKRFVWCIVGGMITTLLLSWLMVMLRLPEPKPEAGGWSDGETSWLVQRSKRLFSDQLSGQHLSTSSSQEQMDLESVLPKDFGDWPGVLTRDELPSWSKTTFDRSLEGVEMESISVRATGIPFLAFRAEAVGTVMTKDPQAKVSGGIRLGAAKPMHAAQPDQVVILPLIPIWSGLLLDTLIWGGFFFVGFVLVDRR